MNVRPKFFIYVPAIILMALIIGWVSRNTWRELRQLHRSFSSVQAEDFYLPEYIETTVRELNDTELRICQHHDPADEEAYKDQSETLKQWIISHQDTLTTPHQRQIMKLIGDQFESYLARNNDLMSGQTYAAVNSSKTVAPGSVQSNAAPVLELCASLQASERAEQVQFIKNSKEALSWIQELLVVVLGLLAALIISGFIAVYTGVIGPLQVELVRSRALAIRNEKLASLGTLAAGIAHEIRNPLTAINVRLHSLKKNLARNSSEQEDALVIGDEIQRLEGIVQEFLQFARPAEPKFVVVSADSLIMKIQSLLGPQLERASIRLAVESQPDIWLRADPHQIEQVLINLVRNSAESIEHNGTITIRVNTRPSRLNSKKIPSVTIQVSDTGKGIPPEVQKRIFDPFFTTKEEGTGLGLVIAARIVEKHNGTLECHSEPNRGTTFTISLPTAKTEEIDERTT